MHPHHWVRSPGSFLLNDSGLVAGDGIEPSSPAYETGLEPLQLSRNKFVRIFGFQRPQILAQGEGLEPPPAGLESAMLPAYTNPAHQTGPEPRSRTSNLLDQSQACCPFHQLGLGGPRGDRYRPAGPAQGWFLTIQRRNHPSLRPTYGASFALKANHFGRWPISEPSRQKLHGRLLSTRADKEAKNGL